jgi:hypothetical protein
MDDKKFYLIGYSALSIIIIGFIIILSGMSLHSSAYHMTMITGYSLIEFGLFLNILLILSKQEQNKIMSVICLLIIFIQIIFLITYISKSATQLTTKSGTLSISHEFYTYVNWFNALVLFTTIVTYMSVMNKTDTNVLSKTNCMILLLCATFIVIYLNIISTIVNDYNTDG